MAKTSSKFTGENLRLWRTRMSFSQRDACSQLGCSRGAYARWEKPRAKVPRYIGLACAALALGMTAYGAATAPALKPVHGVAK